MSPRPTGSLLGLLALAALPLCCGLPGAFLQDDRNVVLDPGLAEAGPRELCVDYWRAGSGPWQLGLYRPLSLASFAVLRRLGAGPGIQRALNILIHVANTLLLFLLLRRFAGDRPGASRGAWWGAAFFACHAALADAQIVLVGRADGLATLGVLAAALAFLQRRWLLMIAAAALAALAKETGFFAAPMLAVLALAPAARRDLPWKRLIAPFAGLALGLGAVLALRAAVVGGVATPRAFTPLAGTSLLERLPVVLRAGTAYVELLLAPVFPSFDYAYLAFGGWDWRCLPGLCAGLGLLGLAVVRLRREPWAAWALLALFPVSNLIPIGAIAAPRFLLLPAVGLAGLLAGATRRLPRSARVGLGVGLLTLAGLTALRAAEARHPVAFYARMHARFPAAEKPLSLYLAALERQGRGAEAIERGRAALAARFQYAPAITLARILHAEGEVAAAAPLLESAVRARPEASWWVWPRLLGYWRELGAVERLLPLYAEALEAGHTEVFAPPDLVIAARHAPPLAGPILGALRARGVPLGAAGEEAAHGLGGP